MLKNIKHKNVISYEDFYSWSVSESKIVKSVTESKSNVSEKITTINNDG